MAPKVIAPEVELASVAVERRQYGYSKSDRHEYSLRRGLNFIENNRKRLDDAPFGLYAVVPSPSGEHTDLFESDQFTANEKDIIKPGVVFCLKQKGENEGNEEVNPLNPYFLVISVVIAR